MNRSVFTTKIHVSISNFTLPGVSSWLKDCVLLKFDMLFSRYEEIFSFYVLGNISRLFYI